MSGWKVKGIAAAVALAAVAVALALAMPRGGGDASAQTPNDNETLRAIQDQLSLVISRVDGVGDAVGAASGQIGETRDEVALTRNQIGRLATSIEQSADDPAVYTQAFVEAAISRYESAGRDAAIAHYNAPESMDGQWYVFIIDENDMIVSHAATPANVGVDIKALNGADGWPAGRVISRAASPEGAWVSYHFNNPVSGKVELKHSWLARHDGLIFGSGWYEDAPDRASEPGAYTQLVVERAIHLHETLGRQAAFEHYNSRRSVDGDWYVFAIQNGRIAVHPTVRANIGMSLTGPLGTDIRGKDFGSEMLAANENGAWVEYVYLNPNDDNKYERKHSWLVKHDGIIYGSGWYETNVDFQADSDAFTKAYVEEAMSRYEADPDAALAYYSSPQSVIGDWYMFIVDKNDRVAAHGNVPERVGMDIKERVAPNGYPHGRIISRVADADGEWIEYVLESPTTDEARVKRSWITRRGGVIFGSGWYEPAPSKTTDPAGYTKLYVEQAIQMYKTLGEQAAVSFYNSQASVDGDWYGSIIGTNNRLSAHPNAELRGRSAASITDSSGYPLGPLLTAVPVEGMWIEYDFDRPSGGVGAKHTWLVKRDGRVFSSGWYEAAPSKTSEPGAFTKRYIAKALQLYDIAGRDDFFRYYNSRASVDGEWYMFAIDRAGDIVVQGANPSLRGQSIRGPLGTDSTGKNFGAEIMAATEEGMWVEYQFDNPTTGQAERKRSWVVLRDGLIFGSGWYDE